MEISTAPRRRMVWAMKGSKTKEEPSTATSSGKSDEQGAIALKDDSVATATSQTTISTPSVAFNNMAADSSRYLSNDGSSLQSSSMMHNRLRGSLNTVAKTNSMGEFSHRSAELRKEVKILANSFERKMSCIPNSNSVAKDFSVNKLQFHKVQLVGRDRERKLLEERLMSLTTNVEVRRSNTNRYTRASLNTSQVHVGHRELILISGVSGSGKSALAKTLQDQLQGRVKNGVFVRGKFDLQASDKPYSTIITACHDLGVKIKSLQDNQDDGALPVIQKLRRELVGMELRILIHMVPVLQEILDDDSYDPLMEGSRGSQSASLRRIDANLKRMRSNESLPRDKRMHARMRSSGSLPRDQRMDARTRSSGSLPHQKMGSNSSLPSRQGQAQLSGQTKELLESAFKKFFRIVSFYLAPMVLSLDDLQWSDIHTLELLKGLLSDTTNPNLMIVGCFRSNEVDQTHSLAKLTRDLKQTSAAMNLHITEVNIDNLAPKETNQILMALLNMDDADKTREFAELCHQRTDGNPFFLLLYVDMLYRNGMLAFHLGTFSWQWDIPQIKAATGATANVVDLMINKILNCSDELIHLLKLACCLGNIFTGSMLFLVWAMSPETIDGQSERSETKDEIFKELLEETIKENLLERCDEGLRWCHDKVQEAAMLLEPEELFGPRKYQVGRTLHTCLEGDAMEDNLFCVVDLLNSGPGCRSSSMELATLNLRAARKAKLFGALSAQAEYSEMGLDNLPSDCWVRCKTLALDLYSIRAEAASSMGDFETMDNYCSVVFAQEECSIVDKIPCYKVFIHNFARHGKYKEAIRLEIEVLGKLGCKLPNGNISQALKAVMTLLRFKKKLEKITPTQEEFLEMPLMSEPVHKHTMSLLASLILHAYVSSNKMLWLLGTIRMVYLTLQHGLADQSQLAFSSASVMITHALGNWKMGPRYAHLALSMCDELPLDERSNRSSTLCVSEGMVLAWIKPMKGQLRWLMEGYRSGMELGDVEWAFSNIAVYVESAILSGMQLNGLAEDIGIYLSQFESMCTNGDYAKRVRMVWQTVMNLVGHSDNTTLISGLAFSDEHWSDGDAAISDLYFMVLKSFLCVHFGDHEQGAVLALERGNTVYEQSPGHPMGMPDPFLRAMSLYAMAAKTRHSKYKRHANKARATVKAWLRKGNPNVYHQLELLNAERAALSKSGETCDLYHKAARLAIRGGFLHDAALASERHAEFLIRQGDNDGATLKLKEAIERYSSWGAIRKADQIKETYADLL